MAKHKLPVAKTPVPVKIVNDTPMETKVSEDREKKWRAEDDLRTIKQFKEIEKDKARMRAAKAVAREQMKALERCTK